MRLPLYYQHLRGTQLVDEGAHQMGHYLSATPGDGNEVIRSKLCEVATQAHLTLGAGLVTIMQPQPADDAYRTGGWRNLGPRPSSTGVDRW